MEVTTNQIKTLTLDAAADKVPPAGKTESQQTVQSAKPVQVEVQSIEQVEGKAQAQTESVVRLDTAVTQINDHVQNLQRSLQFTVDEASGKDIVTVLDKETEEVIRQFPSEEVLEIARLLREDKDKAISLFNSQA